jgi:predicted dithiol-disulfide oxidoreductase (DUF899 family)
MSSGERRTDLSFSGLALVEGSGVMKRHKTGTREEWLVARLDLLEAEKELMHRSDDLARRRQGLPWVRIDKDYRFETANGSASLADLFGGRSQLLVLGCTGCSFVADHFDGVIPHLNGHDVTLVCESIAPLNELQAYKRQMGWQFPWVSSLGSDFKYDFGAAFTEEQQKNGADLDGGAVYHTYSTYARGVEALMGTYHFLDLAPWGRNEDKANENSWWRRHDEYAMD